MTRFIGIIIVSVAAIFGGGIGISAAQEIAAERASSDAIPIATPMPQSAIPGRTPAGFIGFCLRNADQCALPDDSAVTAQLTSLTWELLTRVNRATNNSILSEDDREHYGRADYWTIAADGYGDCEDFALTKRKALIDAGLPVAALRIAVVLTRRKERHAVLTVATDRGDFVLDSLNDDVQPWTDTDYVWLERQDPKQVWGWDMLYADNSAATPVAATRP